MSISYYPVPSSAIKYSSFKKDARASKFRGLKYIKPVKGEYVPKGTEKAFILEDTKKNWLFVHELDKEGNVELCNYQLSGDNDSSSIIAKVLSYYKCKASREGEEDAIFSAYDFRHSG